MNVRGSDGRSPLILAASVGDAASLFRAGADINAKWHVDSRTEYTILDLAVKPGHIECVKFLIQNGIPVDNEAVLLAAANGRTECLEVLIEAGADVNLCERRSWPLELATRMNSTLELLIREGADVNVVHFGETALHSAASRGLDFSLQLLIQAGADVNLGGNETPLMLAAEQGKATCVRTLINAGADVHRTDVKGQTALTRPINRNHEECIDLLMEAGADVNNRHLATAFTTGLASSLEREINTKGRDANGRTALHNVVREGRHQFVVDSLIKSGAEVNAVDDFDHTPLLYAVQCNHITHVKALISAGANVNYETPMEQQSPILVASKNGNSEIVKILIDSGANLNVADNHGDSPLIHASREGKEKFFFRTLTQPLKHNSHHKCVSLLLDRGADVNLVNKEGSSALLETTILGNEKSMKLLLEAGADVNWKAANGTTALMYVARNRGGSGQKPVLSDSSTCMKLLLEGGAHINTASQDGSTALMEATNSGENACVQLLLKSGADVKMTDKRGLTALMMAFYKDVVKTLLQHGASVNWPNDEGLTPLLNVARGGVGSAPEIVELLLEAGADVNATDVNKTSVLAHAARVTRRLHDPKTVKLVIKRGAYVNIRNVCGQNSLKYYLAMSIERDEKLALLLFAAGELLDVRNIRRIVWRYGVKGIQLLDRFDPTRNGQPVPVPDCLLQENPIICLKYFCRRAIRKHLLKIDLHRNLFQRVPRLGLPPKLQKYLLFETTLDLADGPLDNFKEEEFKLLGPQQKACRIYYKRHGIDI